MKSVFLPIKSFLYNLKNAESAFYCSSLLYVYKTCYCTITHCILLVILYDVIMKRFIANTVSIVHFHLNILLINEVFFCKSNMCQSISTAKIKACAPHKVCRSCVQSLRRCSNGKQKSLAFGVPMVWTEPKAH